MHEDAAARRRPGGPVGRFRDLRPRIISGLILSLLALGLTLAGPRPFTLLVLVVVLLMSWEWGRVVRGRKLDVSFLFHAATACAGTVLAGVGHPLLGVIIVIAGAMALIALTWGKTGRLSAFGVLYVGLPAIALVWLRGDPAFGFLAVLYVFLIVSAADTAAFVGGRLMGGAKLWPSISPNKTWAGLISAVVAAGCVGLAFAALVTNAAIGFAVLVALGLGLVSQLGDLAESALKRGHGVKDASDLIPGHGGFMDRMDGLVAVAVAGGLLALLVNAKAPSHALLFGN